MEDSTPTVTRMPEPVPSQNWVATRAIMSAAVFGTIGQFIGGWLGRHIGNKVVEPMMRLSMGSFWAVLAAYSSLKASAMERGETVLESPLPEAPVVKEDVAPELPNAKVPLSLIELDTLKEHGQLQAEPELERAAK